MKRVHLKVTGRVQGVAYRYFIREKAKHLKVNGWVRNLDSGKVEIIAEGEDEPISQFLEYCKKGPLFAKIDHVEVIPEKPTGEFSDFEVKV